MTSHPPSVRSFEYYPFIYAYVFFPSGFLTKTLHAFLFSPCLPYTPPATKFLPTRMIFNEKKKHETPYYAVFFPAPSYSLLGQNIFLSTLFSKIFSLSSSDNVRDQGPHPCRTTGKILLPLILIFIILDCTWKGKRY